MKHPFHPSPSRRFRACLRSGLVCMLLVAGCLPDPVFRVPDFAFPEDPPDMSQPAPPDARVEPDLRDPKASFTYDRGAITRGARDVKVMALVYTGGFYADGGPTILNELQARGLKASFYFTGDFLRRAEFKPIIERIRDEGHYLGAHSDKHLLYASWDNPPRLLVTREQFDEDLTRNLVEIERFGIPRERARFYLPPYEHYTPEIAAWTAARGMVLHNFTPGTRSHLDYLEDGAGRRWTARLSLADAHRRQPAAYPRPPARLSGRTPRRTIPPRLPLRASRRAAARRISSQRVRLRSRLDRWEWASAIGSFLRDNPSLSVHGLSA
jgi:peptidoglycan/xylan/chitin deacetylase (PgdA/CDA1 family)